MARKKDRTVDQLVHDIHQSNKARDRFNKFLRKLLVGFVNTCLWVAGAAIIITIVIVCLAIVKWSFGLLW